MKARFIGDPRDNFSGPDVFPLRGVVFIKDEWTSVADEDLFAKLQTHNHFETAEDGLKPFKADDFHAAVRETALAEFDINTGEGFGAADQGVIVGEPAPDVVEEAPADEKAQLIAELETIPGAEFDGRWGVPKLRQALEAAKFMAGDED